MTASILHFTTPSFDYDIASSANCKNVHHHQQHERPIIELCDRTKLSHQEKKLLFPVDDDSDEGENHMNHDGYSSKMSLGSCDIFDDLSYDDDDAFASSDEDDNDTTITAAASISSSSSSISTRQQKKSATAATASTKQKQQRRRRRFTRRSGESSSSSVTMDSEEEDALHLSYSSYILTSTSKRQNPALQARLPLHMELTY